MNQHSGATYRYLEYLMPWLPPSVIHTLDFLHHFLLFFVLPIATVVFCAVLAAAVVGKIRRMIFARYATPLQLLDQALRQLKRSERKGKTPNVLLFSTTRERALDTLKLVIQLEPRMLKPHVVLATELFYGEMNDGSEDRAPGRPRRRTNNNTALRRMNVQSPDTLSPELIECREIIKHGLRIDPENKSLLKLQNELKLIEQYGKHGVQAKMMNVGSFGFG